MNYSTQLTYGAQCALLSSNTKALRHTSDDDRINISFAFDSLLLLIVLVGKIHKLSSPLKSQIFRYSQFIRQFIKNFDEKTENHALIQKREEKNIVHVSICMMWVLDWTTILLICYWLLLLSSSVFFLLRMKSSIRYNKIIDWFNHSDMS